MKKTISLTLGRRAFIMEEDGYAVLETYLADLQRHFAGETTVDEVVADIEYSIAEKFSDRLTLQKTIITLEDVNEVLFIMGKVEEIDDTSDEGDSEQPEKAAGSSTTEIPKRLYRDEDQQVIAGVASGLAAYFGIDPLIIRIGFLVLALINGLGIILYLILWVAIPLAKTSVQKLEMRGKPVTVNEIQELVKEKAEQMYQEGARAVQGTEAKPSIFMRILNVPVVFIGAIFAFIKGVFQFIGPIIRILFGTFVLGMSVIGMAATTMFAAVLAFRVNSPAVVSDLPLMELAKNPLYYLGVGSGYLLVMIPLFFVAILGVSCIRRKNQFGLVLSSVLVGLWIAAAGTMAVSASALVPWTIERTQQLEQQATITKTLDQTNFDRLIINGNQSVTVKQGETFSVVFTGRESELANLTAVNTQGVLSLSRVDQQQGICLFCSRRTLKGVITMPTLTEYTGKRSSRGSIEGFSQDLSLTLEENADAELALQGQQATTTLRDYGSRLTITGTASRLTATLTDVSRLFLDNVKIGVFILDGRDSSRVEASGMVDQFQVDLRDAARLDAENLESKNVSVTATDHSYAQVYPTQAFAATSTDSSRVEYERTITGANLVEEDRGSVRRQVEERY